MSDARIYRPKKPREKSPPALDLLDEAFHRLRAAPLIVLGIYYFGTLPFVLGLLYFWADLSHSADAERYGTGAALGLATLFLWMKFCHADFARRLRAIFNHHPPQPWSARRLLDFFIVQSVLHSVGLFVLVVAAVVTVPMGWAYAFCQSATAIGAGESGTVREVLRRSLRVALLWPKQNHLMLLILSGLGLFVWLNVLIAVIGLPYLLKLLTGEENLFTRGGLDLFNSTFFAVTLSLAYLLLDPVIKTFYVLRCFYADSLFSGEDLRSELHTLPVLKTAPVPTGAAALAVVLLLGLLPLAQTRAAPVPDTLPALTAAVTTQAPVATTGPAGPGPGADIRPLELDKSIEEVMHRREFAWRVPPPAQTDAPPASGFFSGVARWLENATDAVFRPIGHGWTAFWDWVHALKKKWFPDDKKTTPAPVNEGGGFDGGARFLRPMVYVLIAVIAAVVLFESWKAWRRRGKSSALAGRAASSGALAVSDLSNDEVLATQLPEDEWLQLARRLRESGEHRLALRAFYLSILSLLGTRGLLAVARHKSNRDYLAELRRRARERPELQMAFARNVGHYERVWYGPHSASQELFEQFLADRQIICDDPALTQTQLTPV